MIKLEIKQRADGKWEVKGYILTPDHAGISLNDCDSLNRECNKFCVPPMGLKLCQKPITGTIFSVFFSAEYETVEEAESQEVVDTFELIASRVFELLKLRLPKPLRSSGYSKNAEIPLPATPNSLTRPN
jgi:hypothetical protein